MEDDSRTVLFLPTCDSLAHASRMLVVARALRRKFMGRIVFAGSGSFGQLVRDAGFPFYDTADGEIGKSFRMEDTRAFMDRRWSFRELREFLHAVEYSYCTFIEHELALYRTVQPQLVIWDARFSVSISAALSGVPSVAVVHAWLTPYSVLKPVFPHTAPFFAKYPWLRGVTKLPKNAQGLFASWFWSAHALVFVRLYNKLLAHFHLAPVRGVEDVFRRFPTVLLPDLPAMAPTADLPAHFHYTGPLVWEPDMELPESLKALQGILYVSMGSTGNPRVFQVIAAALSALPEVEAVMTTGDLIDPDSLGPLSSNVHVYRYLPGVEMVKRARLVICHGGLGTVYQALSQGVPVIGIPFIPAQEVPGIDRVVALGAGKKLSVHELSPWRVSQAIREVLEEREYRESAQRIAVQFTLEEGPERAADILLRTISPTSGDMVRVKS